MVVPYAIRSYTVVVHKAEEGGYWAEVLELPGCVSQGETIDELRSNIMEALEAVLASETQDAPSVKIQTEKGVIHFMIQESQGGKLAWVEVSDTWTALE